MLRRTALKRKAPITQKAAERRKPMRRNAPKAVSRGVKPNARQKRYWDSLARVCEGCGCTDHVVPHHILADAPGKTKRRDHMLIVMLHPGCHTDNGVSVHKLGSEAAFLEETGVDLVGISVRNRDHWEADNAR